MKRNVLLVVTIVTLFVIPLGFVHAVPLESFAENPIPYWEDDSLGINTSWDSVEQTVTTEWANDSLYWEDMSDISDWDTNSLEAGDTATTDGDILAVETASVGADYDNFVATVTIPTDGYIHIKYKVNQTVSVFTRIYLLSVADSYGPPYYRIDNLNSLVWSEDTYKIDELLNSGGHFDTINQIWISSYKAIATAVNFEFDFIRVWALGDLDISVPVMPQSIQSVELMGNFSALNSTVRFEMYDNDTASGLFCDVNSTHVTFPNDDYALFTNIARINFSLDEERILFRIYVFAQNLTLINSYADYTGLANKDYIRMTSTVFNGTYELWYLQGDIGYIEEVIDMSDNMFYQLFLSTEIWGWFGPLIIIGVSSIILTNKKLKPLGILFVILEFLIISQYFELVEETPWYWWNIIIMVLGMIICIGQMWSK